MPLPRSAIAAEPDVFFYPTQRPELNLHLFMPLPAQPGVHLLRRRATHELQEAAEALRKQ